MDEYLRPYRQSLARHGTGFGVTLWASVKSQERRFAVFAESCDLMEKRVLDAGCSRGDFATFLHEATIVPKPFIGVDALPELIDFARSRNLPDCEFHVADFVRDPQALRQHQPQVVIISGALNTMQDAQVMTVLESAWAAASETLMFNFLSDRAGPLAPPQDNFSRRLSAMHLLDWALGKTWHVVFRQDYFPNGHDATIIMQHTKSPTGVPRFV